MFLQGNLQLVFDALYGLGVIDPVLQMDWGKEMDDLPQYYNEFQQIIVAANHHQGDVSGLMHELNKFPVKTLHFLAMEVAREYAEFHSRENLQ
jgi:hypothetical protein